MRCKSKVEKSSNYGPYFYVTTECGKSFPVNEADGRGLQVGDDFDCDLEQSIVNGKTRWKMVKGTFKAGASNDNARDVDGGVVKAQLSSGSFSKDDGMKQGNARNCLCQMIDHLTPQELNILITQLWQDAGLPERPNG